MDAPELVPLIQPDEINLDFLKEAIQSGELNFSIRYDEIFDALMIVFCNPDTEHAVHYLYGDNALLISSDTLDVVGIQIENFSSLISFKK